MKLIELNDTPFSEGRSTKESEFVQKHGKMMVNLQITKIRKHISTFDFEDDYEEI